MTHLSSPTQTPEAHGRVLLIDDDPVVRRTVARALSRAGHEIIQAGDASQARALLETGAVDVALIDLRLPDARGVDLIPEIVARKPHVGAIVLTGSDQRTDMLEAMRLGASGYLRKPADPVALEAQVTISLEVARRTRAERLERLRLDAELERSHTALGEVAQRFAEHLTSAWDLRHVETGAHVRRIASFTAILARAMGESELRSRNLAHAAMLHDVGKIMIPDAILAKPGPLTPAEFEIMKTHPVLGARLLEGISHPLVELAREVALFHHERWNGSGYPQGLVGTKCPWEARVVAIVDVYDALGQPRCYKPAWDEARIVAHFQEASGVLYEAPLVQALFDGLPELRAASQAFPDSARWELEHSGTWLKAGAVPSESTAESLAALQAKPAHSMPSRE